MRDAILRSAAALAACATLAAGARAAEPAQSSDRLEKAIQELRKEYLAKLDAKDEDHELRNLIRDLNVARNKGDWNRVAELLAARGIDVGGAAGAAPAGAGSAGDGTDAADELWPVRTDAPGAASKPEDKFESERVNYTSAKGRLKISAIVYRPKESTGKAPVIVLAHEGLRGIRLASRRLAEDLAGVGYIVYVPEFRGQGRSEGKIEWADGEVFDLLAAVEEAKKLPGADPGRVGLVGAGHGGAATLIALARVEGVACAAAISPPTDLTALAKNRRFTDELKLLGAPLNFGDREELQKHSPLYFVAGISVPVFVLHGVRDRTVPVRLAEEYCSAAKNRGKDVKLERYGLSDEGLVSKLSVYRADLHDFLAQYLKPPGWKISKSGKGGKGGAPAPDQPGARQGRRRRN